MKMAVTIKFLDEDRESFVFHFVSHFSYHSTSLNSQESVLINYYEINLEFEDS